MRFSQSRSGGPYCPPLNIHFPVIHRVVQSASRAQLDAIGLTDVEPFSDAVHYTLDDENAIPARFTLGDITFEPLQHGPPEPDGPTLVVRYHRNADCMASYHAAIYDLFDCPDEDDDDDDAPVTPIGTSESCGTKDGLFTMTLRPSHRLDASQPGPLLIYIASYPAPPPLPSLTDDGLWRRDWYLALAADGSEVRLDDLDPPPK